MVKAMKDFTLRWHWTFIDVVGAILSLAIVLWLALPTGFFLRPSGLLFDGTDTVFARTVPFGSVYAYWSLEVRRQGRECYAPEAPRLTLYQAEGMDGTRAPRGEPIIVRYPTPEALLPCMSETETFRYVQTQQMMVFGVLPLRPSSTRWSCRADGTACVRMS